MVTQNKLTQIFTDSDSCESAQILALSVRGEMRRGIFRQV